MVLKNNHLYGSLFIYLFIMFLNRAVEPIAQFCGYGNWHNHTNFKIGANSNLEILGFLEDIMNMWFVPSKKCISSCHSAKDVWKAKRAVSKGRCNDTRNVC